MRMKCRLFSVSLSVSMAMPPMPAFSSSDVSVELNVSAKETCDHIEDRQSQPDHIRTDLEMLSSLCATSKRHSRLDEASSSDVQTYQQTAPCV